jgi:tetratricopeptide (TPR) repeat protein
MGRSLVPVSRIDASLRYGPDSHDPFDALGTQFRIDKPRETMEFHQSARDEKGAIVYDLATPVDFALGSGTRGYSFLTNHDGYLFQAPVSWFSQKQIWDVSPGYIPDWRAGRPVSAECLYCHANRVLDMEGYANRYQGPIFDGFTIGCERCHGPGQRHVAAEEHPLAPDVDPTIVNPKHLGPELRAAICEQCHVTGEARVIPRGRELQDFRPGLPFEAFRSILVLGSESSVGRKAIGHFEQMQQSQCYISSVEKPQEGKRELGCTSCHDPHRHVVAENRNAYYRERCLSCHQARDCSEPEPLRRKTSKDDSCIDCHMPRYASQDIAHNASTDHRIMKKLGETAPAPPGPTRDAYSFQLLHADRFDAKDRERQRDLGIGLSHVLGRFASQAASPPPRLGRQALDLLDKAVRDDHDDLRACEAKGEVLSILNRPEEALEAYEAVLSRAPRREISLLGAATAAQAARQLDRALDFTRRAVAENPWQASHHAKLAELLAQRKMWNEAREETEAWVRLDPASVDARVRLVICLTQSGDKVRAREEFDRIERLRPSNLPALQAEFSVRLRD